MLSAREIFGEVLLPGDAGTHQTLGRMRELVDVGAQLPEARQAVAAALTTARPRSPQSELSALLEWVQERFHYVRDPLHVELVQTPALMLREIRQRGEVQGDCDDAVVLFATLAESAGYLTRFLVQGPADDLYQHVVAEVQVGERWLAVDPSQGVQGLGWAPPAGREAREMRYRRNGLGQQDSEIAATFPALTLQQVVGEPGLVGPATEFIESPTQASAVSANGSSSFWSDLLTGIKTAVPTILGVAERYGALKPIVGYNPDGSPRYATAALPIGGASGATYSMLTQRAFLGLNWGQVLLIGGGTLLYLGLRRK